MQHFLPIIAKVHYHSIDKEKTIYHTLYCSSLSKATELIEDCYGTDLINVRLACVDAEDTLFEIPKDLAHKYEKDGCFLDT